MTIAVHNRQKRVRFDLPWLKKIARSALGECSKRVAPGTALSSLEAVDVTIVSDEEIAAVHKGFMDLPGATDVITFDHGEIIISADTAVQNAAHFVQPLEHELALYVIHGLLHLNGYDDQQPAAAAQMRQLQESILRQCLDASAPSSR